MALLKRSEVLLMHESVLVYGFKLLGLPYFQEDSVQGRKLFTDAVGMAVLRFRCANERAYRNNIRQHLPKQLLEPSSVNIIRFARKQVEHIFSMFEENFIKYFRCLAFILDLSVYAYRYKRLHLMNPVFLEFENVYNIYLFRDEGVPFWRHFFALCDVILRQSPTCGQPPHHFRNPAIEWDPTDEDFDPDDPAYDWELPFLVIHREHSILKPDYYAMMKAIDEVNEMRLENVRTEDQDRDIDEDLSLTVESLNLNPKSTQSSSFSTDSLNLGADSSGAPDLTQSGQLHVPQDGQSRGAAHSVETGGAEAAAEDVVIPVLDPCRGPFEKIVTALFWKSVGIDWEKDAQDNPAEELPE